MASNGITKLLKVMRQLRDPKDGCEWDKLQTHESLIPFLEEESQEVIAVSYYTSDAADDP